MIETKTKKTASSKAGEKITKATKTTKAVKKSVPVTKKSASSVAKTKATKKVVKKESGKYFEAVGRRKTSTARVRLFEKGDMEIIINDNPLVVYFPTEEMQKIVESPLAKTKTLGIFRVTVKVVGGGIHSQSEAVRHGITRALMVFDLNLRTQLKKEGYVKRDPRAKERRKFGLKKARKAAQWSKR